MEAAGATEEERAETLLRKAILEERRFLNPVPTSVGGWETMRKTLPLYFKNKEEKFPRVPPGPFRTDATVYATPPASGLRVTWMGHSSTLLEIDGTRVLLDPVWDERASPLRWAGPKRFLRRAQAVLRWRHLCRVFHHAASSSWWVYPKTRSN